MTDVGFCDVKASTRGKVGNMLHMATEVKILLSVGQMALLVPDYVGPGK